MGSTYSQGVNLAFTLNKLQPVLGSDTNSITSEVLTPLKIYIMVLWDNTVYSSYGLFYIFLYLCVFLFLLDQKHSIMITTILNQAILPIFKRESPTFTDFVWPCNLKHHSCWHNDLLLLVYMWELLCRKFCQQFSSWIIGNWIENVWDCSTHSACGKNHHWSETITAQPMICNVNDIHVCALMNNLIDNTNKCTSSKIQAGFCLCDFFLCSFAVTQLENLPHFLNLCNNV